MRWMMRWFWLRLLSLPPVLLCLTSVPAAGITTEPSGLEGGTEYRLAFVTSTPRDALSSDIADYNAFVDAVANAVPALAALGTTWTAIASTASIDARDNTGTNPLVGVGVPIYLLDDTLLVSGNADLWDGSIGVPLRVTELGTTVNSIIWTGTTPSGVASFFGMGHPAGPAVGRSFRVDTSWVDGTKAFGGGTPLPLYAISGVLTVPSELVVSYGVQGGQPSVESFIGVSVRPQDAVNLDTAELPFGLLLPGEDLDAVHFRSDGSVLFSTTTSVFLGGVQYLPGDVILLSSAGVSLAFDGSLLDAGQNVDAVSELPNGNLLLSTSTSATLFGFSFLDGDVVEVDVAGTTASLFMGLDEATLFTGTNQDIDALDFEAASGKLLISLEIDGVGTVAGLAYGTADEISNDVIELDLSGSPTASVLLDGQGLYDGATRQLDAVYLPEPAVAGALAACSAFLLVLSRRRTAG